MTFERLKFEVKPGQDWISLTEKCLENKSFHNPYQPLKDNTRVYYADNPQNKQDINRNMEFVSEMVSQYKLLADYVEISQNEKYKNMAQKGKEIIGGFLEIVGSPKEGNYYNYNKWACKYFQKYINPTK
jgi:hypothetical protein